MRLRANTGTQESIIFSITLVSESDLSYVRIIPEPDHLAASDSATDQPTAVPTRIDLSWTEIPRSLVRIENEGQSWSFWPDNVSDRRPIFVPQFGLAVTTPKDRRTYGEIAKHIAELPDRSQLQLLTAADEDSYEAAAKRGRLLQSPTWLGVGRDYRLFALGFNGIGASNATERIWDWIAPQWHGQPVNLAEAGDIPIRFHYMLGRGIGPVDNTSRRLRAGYLPILEVERLDGQIQYDLTAFVGLENGSPLAGSVEGTPYLVADGQSEGHMFTEEQTQAHTKLTSEFSPQQETVLFMRISASNTASTPAYAFVRVPEPHNAAAQTPILDPVSCSLDPDEGVLEYESGRIAMVATLGGNPLAKKEIVRMLQPGETIEFDLRIPHEPISLERARMLMSHDFGHIVFDCEEFWREKLGQAASVDVPDLRTNQMIKAGLLHLDLITYGTEPHGTVAPTIGIYAPIGSESAPIIQAYDSFGWTRLAERSLSYFIEKQHDDGLMQNFGGYTLETEAVLWSMGEHYRYTQDERWLAEVFPSIQKAVNYVLGRRQRSVEERTPFNLITGKTSDPDDPFPSFMLNGFAVLGLSRAAELAAVINPSTAAEWHNAAEELRRDLVAALEHSVARSPVIPLGNGSWVRTAPPWADAGGPVALRRDDGIWYTHGTFFARDSLNGPLWLILQEVLDPTSQLASELLAGAAELYHVHNGALSQPFYSPHALAHLRRGEVKPFLAAYFSSFVGLSDPDTYSFWEHYFHASPHKTHEEAWFLMQTRWMLYLEDKDTLRLLTGIPRRWLSPGQRIRLSDVRSYFGPFNALIEVDPGGNSMLIEVDFAEDRAPRWVDVRIPHPLGKQARHTTAGTLVPNEERLLLPVDEGKVGARVFF